MKNSIIFFQLVILISYIGLAGCIPNMSSNTPSVDMNTEEEQVKHVLNQFFVLAEKREWDAVGEILTEDFEIYTDDATKFDKGAYVKLLKEDDLVVQYWDLKDVVLRVSRDGRTAWGKYRGVFSHMSRGTQHDVETVETLIFRKENEKWRITHAHASVKYAAGSHSKS